MPTKCWLDDIPQWVLLSTTVLMVLGSIEGGYRLALFRKRQTDKEDAPVNSIIGSTLGLLAFLLAFTFGMAATRFDTRRELLLNEVTALETVYLRAGLVTEARMF